MYLTVLCKVVDNFGDIGVAWRLCRRLAKIQSKYKICLVVDDLEAFAKIEDRLPRHPAQVPDSVEGRNDESSVITSSGEPVIAEREEPAIASNDTPVIARTPSGAKRTKQSVIIDDIEIFHWHDDELCHEVFSRNDGEKLSLILELFQCGRPDWMERILFEEKLQRTVQIIMIDYLTAEKYAEDFHCLQSLTRSSKVKKVNFMPGFTEKTGGLVIDEEWQELSPYNADGNILVFTYENDWQMLAKALVDYCEKDSKKVMLAQGRGKESFMNAVKACGAEKFVEELPYLNQTEWDKMMKSCSALVIRGEESMSRACLSGIPFIWQAYPQSDEYQLVKVSALLERMRAHFDQADFEIVEKAWIAINTDSGLPRRCAPLNDEVLSEASSLRPSTGSGNGAEYSLSSQGADCYSSLRAEGEAIHSSDYTNFFNSLSRLCPGFVSFAMSLRKNGDLAANLMTYIEKLAIIL